MKRIVVCSICGMRFFEGDFKYHLEYEGCYYPNFELSDLEIEKKKWCDAYDVYVNPEWSSPYRYPCLRGLIL